MTLFTFGLLVCCGSLYRYGLLMIIGTLSHLGLLTVIRRACGERVAAV
jgi:hypothetical protein